MPHMNAYDFYDLQTMDVNVTLIDFFRSLFSTVIEK